MPIREWEPEMSVQLELLDDQHKVLLQILNDAFEASRVHDETRVFELIDRMVEYTEKHFSDEEEILEETCYPDTENHKALHEHFTNQVRELHKKKYEHVNLMSIFKLLSDWLTRHIMDVDKKYVQHVCERKQIPNNEDAEAQKP